MTRIISSRMVAGLSAATLLAAGAPASAQDAAAQKEQVVCQLLDNCDAAPADPAATAPRGTPRGSATRGFSLARPKADSAPAAATTAPAGKSAYATKPKPAKNPAGAGRYDLNVTFRTASADLAPSARSRAALFAGALKDPRLAGRRVRIEGHTDSVGDPARNRDLSERRAHAVADLLVASGVEQGRLDVAGYGSSQPLPGEPGTSGAQRRVVAVLVK